jgi:hypothetical protein
MRRVWAGAAGLQVQVWGPVLRRGVPEGRLVSAQEGLRARGLSGSELPGGWMAATAAVGPGGAIGRLASRQN